jgi:hypothetical protein
VAVTGRGSRIVIAVILGLLLLAFVATSILPPA